MHITLKGGSSGTKRIITFQEDEKSNVLMNFLHSKGVPIASSCRGERVCQRCIIGEQELMSCAITLGDYLTSYGSEITVSYM